MVSNNIIRGRKQAWPSNIYTIILALAVVVVCATCFFVATKCYLEYNTLFKIAEAAR